MAQADLDHIDIRRTLAECAAALGLRISDTDEGCSPTQVKGSVVLDERSELLSVAVAWVNARKQRNAVFGEYLFADPAWDMLLDLFINHCRRKKVAVSSLGIASHVPATTALRWIAALERDGLVTREPDVFDGRRLFIVFTPTGIKKMKLTLRQASESINQLGQMRQCAI